MTVTAANPYRKIYIRHRPSQPGDGVSAAALQHASDHKITMGRPAEIVNSVIPKQRPQEFRQWRGLRRWGTTGFSSGEDVPWSDNHATRLGEELGEWVLNTDQSRVRRGAIEHDVEPVFVAKIAGTCPFVG